ncbi:uroporphyrinogen-III synthase [Leucobacter massiliensis]|uniref:Tetrapyrrole biosynthesis uroporphyrinogen III synthase domain-containing protein n=1 Tax=Leucobacter massiliensis TaxID=1686285 RepID=A0A2S9QLT8_9MICO|nr:uroporphyrinogen-III synthase [Leucobacter massiliensis]PRI10541.1 hypothetical protein B4915_11090 [Leucobacter massiliensis]
MSGALGGAGSPAPVLAGLRILVPRGEARGERFAAQVRSRGGEPVIAPLTETAPPSDPAPLRQAIARWNRGETNWLVVTSAEGARAVADAGIRPAPAAAGARVAAVGPATAEALAAAGLRVDLVPERDYSATGLAAALRTELAGGPAASLLLPLSEIAGDELASALTAAGHRPERVTAYRTVPAPRDAAAQAVEAEVAAGGIDAILVSSGSGAREVARRFAPVPRGTAVVAIGPPTARALAECGLRADAVAETHTVEGLLDALEALIASRPTTEGTPA